MSTPGSRYSTVDMAASSNASKTKEGTTKIAGVTEAAWKAATIRAAAATAGPIKERVDSM